MFRAFFAVARQLRGVSYSTRLCPFVEIVTRLKRRTDLLMQMGQVPPAVRVAMLFWTHFARGRMLPRGMALAP